MLCAHDLTRPKALAQSVKVRPSYTASHPLMEWKVGHIHQDCLDGDRGFAFGNLAPKHGCRSTCGTATTDGSESGNLLTRKQRLLR
jgi:hypothetical protein